MHTAADHVERYARVDGLVAAHDLPAGTAMTYAELDRRSNRLAHALTGLGARPGDRVACWLSTGIPYLEVYVAAAKAGLIVVPLNERATSIEASYVVADADPRFLVHDDASAERVGALETGRSPTTIACGACRDGGAHAYDDLVGGASDDRPRHRPAPDADYLLAYTSGTSGFPKGAVLTQESVLSINRSNALAYQLPLGSVGIYSGSMSFTATVPAFLLTHLYVGGTIVMTGTRDPDAVVDAVERFHGTYLAVPPPMVLDYAAAFARDRHRIRSLRSVLQSAGKAPAAQLLELNRALDGRLLLGWGMSELSGGLATVTPAPLMRTAVEAGDLRVHDSVGVAVPDCRVELLGPDGEALPWDAETVGELAISGPALMRGYWRRGDADPRSLVDGWYHTGDLGTVDADGLVHIVERRSDLIVSGGMNVYPSEVERVLAELDGVAECAVFGFPHERWGQAVGTAIVVRAGSALEEDDVIAHCRRSLASYKKPVRVEFVADLPRTASGKVQRSALAQRFGA